MPADGILDLDKRINQFYQPMPTSADGGVSVMPKVSRLDQNSAAAAGGTFNYTQLNANQQDSSESSSRNSHRSGSAHSRYSLDKDGSLAEESSFDNDDEEVERELTIEDLLDN